MKIENVEIKNSAELGKIISATVLTPTGKIEVFEFVDNNNRTEKQDWGGSVRSNLFCNQQTQIAHAFNLPTYKSGATISAIHNALDRELELAEEA